MKGSVYMVMTFEDKQHTLCAISDGKKHYVNCGQTLNYYYC